MEWEVVGQCVLEKFLLGEIYPTEVMLSRLSFGC
ncbi:hypothetical protein SULPSESMR1_00758 [Pseudosulfitobacter pseudonitzschiae]|uniref:Uncharacterized protein n=1 Tax=Pseudosulfitobacter pseudonitzschiae TaxID=1402135 RepID=A0A221JXX3_9RHOB|nr:hypothetical protein SULPSESMR1_00758 [Pseudosulfitobacter pseudonitzschiae]